MQQFLLLLIEETHLFSVLMLLDEEDELGNLRWLEDLPDVIDYLIEERPVFLHLCFGGQQLKGGLEQDMLLLSEYGGYLLYLLSLVLK